MSVSSVASSKKSSESAKEHGKKDKKKDLSVTSSNGTFYTEDLDDLSRASSVLTKAPSKLAPQFMPSSCEDASTGKFPEEVLGLPESVTDGLQQIGLTTPQRFVNAFGLDVSTIANFFLQFGHECTVNEDTKKHCVHLVMLAHSQVLRPRLSPEDESIDWETVKKKKGHNDSFKNTHSPISKFTKKLLKNTEKEQIGEIIMRMVRKEMHANSRAKVSKGCNNSWQKPSNCGLECHENHPRGTQE